MTESRRVKIVFDDNTSLIVAVQELDPANLSLKKRLELNAQECQDAFKSLEADRLKHIKRVTVFEKEANKWTTGTYHDYPTMSSVQALLKKHGLLTAEKEKPVPTPLPYPDLGDNLDENQFHYGINPSYLKGPDFPTCLDCLTVKFEDEVAPSQFEDFNSYLTKRNFEVVGQYVFNRNGVRNPFRKVLLRRINAAPVPTKSEIQALNQVKAELNNSEKKKAFGIASADWEGKFPLAPQTQP